MEISKEERFNKREEDFPSLREYNDYLEEVEDMSKLTTSQSFQGGVGAGAQGYYAPAVAGGAIGQPRPTGMAPQPIPIGSNLDMHAYNYDNEEMTRLRAERGGRAGGWSMELSRKRALEEAFSSIWI
ncbi:hypothetical protein C3L33_05550, partial [Rhododendron williamsianum]